MKLASTCFIDGGLIPDLHTCKDANTSPDLKWEDVPPGTQSFSLIVDDPDALSGLFTHWIAYNIPAQKNMLPASLPGEGADGLLQGKNDFGINGYGGPCPPKGDGSHRYHFKIFALDRTLDLAPGAGRDELEQAMAGHVLDSAQLTGRYEITM